MEIKITKERTKPREDLLVLKLFWLARPAWAKWMKESFKMGWRPTATKWGRILAGEGRKRALGTRISTCPRETSVVTPACWRGLWRGSFVFPVSIRSTSTFGWGQRKLTLEWTPTYSVLLCRAIKNAHTFAWVPNRPLNGIFFFPFVIPEHFLGRVGIRAWDTMAKHKNRALPGWRFLNFSSKGSF